MCGIVAVISAYSTGFTFKEMNLFNNMLFVDTLRGWDSTGVFSGSKYNNLIIHKAALDGPSFMKTEEYSEFEKRVQKYGMFAVGHNRAATRGTVNDENAHPFWVEDNVVLVQNGTWNGDHKKIKDTEVDTEVIAHLLNEEETTEAALRKVNAAYALAWYDVRKKQLNFIRNMQRPLWKATMQSGAILFASEDSTITWAAEKENMVIKEKPEMLTPHELHSYVMKESGNHEEGVSKLDCSFRYTGSTHYPTQTQAHWGHRGPYRGPAWAEDDAEEERDKQRNARLLLQNTMGDFSRDTGPNQVVGSGKVRPNEVARTFSSVVCDELPQFHTSVALAASYRDVLQPMETKRIMVSLDDYKPANDTKDCCMFYVFGRMCDLDDVAELPCPVYYWCVEASEETVMNMVTQQNLYTVEAGAPHILSFLNNENNRVGATFIYGVKARKVDQQPVEEAKEKVNATLH